MNIIVINRLRLAARARERANRTPRAERLAEAVKDDHTDAELFASWEERGLFACSWCGAPWQHRDHVIAVAIGGDHVVGNLVPACVGCNTSKGARRPLTEWPPPNHI